MTDTRVAIESGADVIFQAPLEGAGGFAGIADFIVKVKATDGDGVGDGGDGGDGVDGVDGVAGGGDGVGEYYEVWDAKFSKTGHPSHVLQLWCYSEMLAEITGQTPRSVG